MLDVLSIATHRNPSQFRVRYPAHRFQVRRLPSPPCRHAGRFQAVHEILDLLLELAVLAFCDPLQKVDWLIVFLCLP
jgi:hypothetical protein